jgi:hypothetical protein
MQGRALRKHVVEVLQLLDPLVHLVDALLARLVHEALELLDLKLVEIEPIKAQLLAEPL